MKRPGERQVEPKEKFGQQTPRRWGWGTPLKKRAATRTKRIYAFWASFVNWLLDPSRPETDPKRTGKQAGGSKPGVTR